MSFTYAVLASNLSAVISADLDEIANQLRAQISPSNPVAKQPLPLATQGSIQEVLLVVGGAEEQHSHPDSDLVFYVLEGGGNVQLADGGVVDAPAGTTIVVPKGVSHAYVNTSPSDSVLIATLSPATP